MATPPPPSPARPSPASTAPDASASQAPATATLRQAAGAVFWSFFGVRKRRDYEADVTNLSPMHLIIMGVLGAALFIAVLLVVVNLVVRH